MWETKNKSEISCVLAGLILREKNIEISESNIKNIIQAANLKIENYWPMIFSRCTKDLGDEFSIDMNIPPSNSILQDQNKKSKAEENKEKKNEEKKQKEDSIKESDEDLGFGLFD